MLHLSEESNVVLQLSNGRVVEIHGKDLTNNGGNFSLSSLLGESNSDIDKIVNFAKSFQQMNDTEQQNDVVRLDDGRVFKKEGKDYVEIAGESFDEDPDVTQGGHRFVQLTRAGETSVADGIKPLMLNRVVDNIPPLGIEYPILPSVIKPFEHGLGGGSWTPLSPFAPSPNTPPVASDDTYNTAFNTPVALNPLANDSDADGNPLTITAINGVPLTPGSAQQINTPNGVVNIDAQGNITFTPNTGFTGQESFSYSISDGQGGSATATGTINVSAAPNTPPVASDDTYNTAFNTPVALNPLANDSDADGNPLTITAINGVPLTPGSAQQINTPNGVVNIDAQGNITFTPNTGFTGQESFSYSISDGQGGSATATGTINVSAVPTLSVGDDTQVEGTNLVHTVTLSNPSSTAQSYAISLTGNTATAGTDFDNNLANAVFSNGVTYDAVTGQITVPAGVTSFTVGYTTTQDIIHEADETTTLTIGGSIGTGTITNNDPAPTISVNNVTATEGTDPYATFTVSLSNPSSGPIVFNPTLSNGTAIVGTDTGTALEYNDGTSWVAVPVGGITFAAGQTSVEVRVAVTDDTIDEADETFNLTATVTSGTTANTSATGVGTIVDSDPAPTISVNNVTATEGTDPYATFTVSLSNP
ncbi:Ig-like domain-containing protein, partial [Acinetobacter towneri]|uniref:Ig-like domain-containing protein n=1 Tax=Acinetobacter towneri TaxID=202956 RepID=UPI002096823E|nr:Ig-like domain-containing protein [Acinetobacter towneri]